MNTMYKYYGQVSLCTVYQPGFNSATSIIRQPQKAITTPDGRDIQCYMECDRECDREYDLQCNIQCDIQCDMEYDLQYDME